jgi:threonine aldolase
MQRRDFVTLGSAMAAMAAPLNLFAERMPRNQKQDPVHQIDFIHDGLQLSAKEYAALLMQMADEGKIKPDNYSNGGVVEELEHKFATLLGKESAIFMPTGTLANHIAIRHLAQTDRRVILQEQSHFYNDSGDCAQTLSGLNLIPLGLNSVEFTLAEVEEIVSKTKKGRVETRIGVIAIESPVRRQYDRMFAFDNMKALSNYAKANDIKMHMDGARLFVQAVHTEITPAMYGELFDTVFISLWKFFNSASGAVITGSKAFTENLFHERRMFGGGLPAAWPFAAVALHYADTFLPDYEAAWRNAESIFAELQKNDHFEIIKFEGGSHIIRMNVKDVNLSRFSEALLKRNIELPVPDEKGFLLKINPSLNKDTSRNVAGLILEALKES